MNKRRGSRLGAIFISAVFILAGCGKNDVVTDYKELDEDITTITIFGNKYETENVTVIEEIISDFMEENPDVRVSYESLKGNEYFEVLEKRMETGNGNDIFVVNHDLALKLGEKGQLADLSGLSTISDYTDTMLEQMQEGEKIYWVPTTVSAFGLYCNMDILKEHKQEVPKTLAEWEEVCDYFVSQGITPIIANNDISLKTLAIGEGFYSVYQKGEQAEIFQKLNAGEEVLSKYLYSGFSLADKFIEKGYIDKTKALNTEKTSDDLEEFVEGGAPFMLTGAWAAGRVREMGPDFEFEVHPYPVLEDGSLLVINADTRLSVNADSEHLEESMRFVEYFTQTENMSKFVNQQSSFSPQKNGEPSSEKEIQPLLAAYESGQTVNGTDELLKLPIWSLTKDAAGKLLSGEPLENVMDWMDKQAEEERNTP